MPVAASGERAGPARPICRSPHDEFRAPRVPLLKVNNGHKGVSQGQQTSVSAGQRVAWSGLRSVADLPSWSCGFDSRHPLVRGAPLLMESIRPAHSPCLLGAQPPNPARRAPPPDPLLWSLGPLTGHWATGPGSSAAPSSPWSVGLSLVFLAFLRVCRLTGSARSWSLLLVACRWIKAASMLPCPVRCISAPCSDPAVSDCSLRAVGRRRAATRCGGASTASRPAQRVAGRGGHAAGRYPPRRPHLPPEGGHMCRLRHVLKRLSPCHELAVACLDRRTVRRPRPVVVTVMASRATRRSS
jgi:hypothetical protein